LWQKMNQDIFPTPALPNIDFVAKTVIIVAAGQKNTGGFDIEITNIQKQSNQTLVYYTETSPAKNCLVTMALEYPYHAIEISKTSDEITFIPQEKIKYCD
ncbi:MAG: hypothetical protein HW405_499, partial [Candidatus Berkelbacteria bacterium]|nr:hypothetical protein [Candidatus Berkelbacteria bacterium]